jgi:gamma-glutamyl-gamma-aminobutyrate hydrolase PuuD
MTGPGPQPARTDAAPARPVIVGITTDLVTSENGRVKADCSLAYAQKVAAAGGSPILLPPIPSLAPSHVQVCDAFIFTGGDDPRTEPFGAPTHKEARPVHPQRQEYETLLLQLLAKRETPVLGVCLGMQMMSLVAGGSLDQQLAGTLATAAQHKGTHQIVPVAGAHKPFAIAPGSALSHHHQAVKHPGNLTIVARSDDGLIEAVADPNRPFYLGVQWHPERTEDRALGQELFTALVAAARNQADH